MENSCGWKMEIVIELPREEMDLLYHSIQLIRGRITCIRYYPLIVMK